MNVELLRQSFELVVSRQPLLVRRFYEILFQRYPQVQRLFGRTPPAAQEKMLTEALVAVIDHLEDAAWFERMLGALGARHVGYGVTPEMYAWVGDALLTTLAEVAGAEWTDELARTWTAAYGAIASTMQAGAARAQAEQQAQKAS
jgi:hemoglobin-like flavoprotein